MGNLGIIRLSDIQGDAQTGPVRQRENITAKFAQLGVSAEDITWAEDLDVSAFHVPPLKRPELRRAILALPPNSTVIFWKMDRFVRRVFPDFADMLTLCADRKLSLVSAIENLDMSGPAGLMQATLLAFLGQMESENNSVRVKDSQAYLRKVGRWRGGRIPYGYRPYKIEGRPGKYLEQDPEAALVLREIVRRIVAGESLMAVAAYLNDEGVPTPIDRARILQGKPRLCECGHDKHDGPCNSYHKCTHRTSAEGKSKKLHEFDECSQTCPAYRPRRWLRESMVPLLRSPALLGHTVEDDRVLLDDDGQPVEFAPGIIDVETWSPLQDRLSERALRPVRTAKTSLLLGIAFCDCGCPLYKTLIHNGTRGVRGHREYEYYRERSQYGCKKTASIRTDLLDALVSRELLKTLGEFEVLRKQPPSARRSELQAELNTVNAQLVQMFKEQLEGRCLRDNHQELNDQLTQRRNELKEKLDAEDPPEEVLIPTGQSFRAKWESMNTTERRLWMLDAGLRVAAVRGRRPAVDFVSRPRLKRSMIAVSDADVHAIIYLGNLGEILRRAQNT